jgi:hypothetical protein
LLLRLFCEKRKEKQGIENNKRRIKIDVRGDFLKKDSIIRYPKFLSARGSAVASDQVHGFFGENLTLVSGLVPEVLHEPPPIWAILLDLRTGSQQKLFFSIPGSRGQPDDTFVTRPP